MNGVRGQKTSRHRRWFGLSATGFEATLRQARTLGIGIIAGGKPGMTFWYSLVTLATAAQMRSLEWWWREQGVKFTRREPAAAWTMPCADSDEVIPWEVLEERYPSLKEEVAC